MFLVKNSSDPTNWIFEASGLHIPSKARDRNERKYYQISTTFLNTYGSHREKQGQCTQLPIISKVKKYHNKNTKKILRKKIKKQEIVCRVYTSQYKVACHDADKESSRWCE